MSKTSLPKAFGLGIAAVVLSVGSAGADESLGLLPGSTCQPIDSASASDFLRNSGGTLANMSAEHAAYVQCPIRMPAVVTTGQTLEWTAHFLTATNGYCMLRVAQLDGELVGSIVGYPLEVGGPAAGQSSWGIQLSAPVGDYGASQLIASVRCRIPPADPHTGPTGITTYSARLY